MTLHRFVDHVLDFAFYYPLLMSYVWAAGAVYYYTYREQADHRRPDDPPPLEDTPFVSFLVPCHNEGASCEETVKSLLDQDYPSFEVIAVDDASSDDTRARLDRLATEHERVRVVAFDKNQGKAMGLRMAALAAHGEFLICLDGDALLDRHATRWMLRHFDSARVGAVTGNPRVRNRTSARSKSASSRRSSVSSSAPSASMDASSRSPASSRRFASRRCTPSATGTST
jgi:biofilm PGA synthesis N-glycosyltransferase PgaC